MRLTISAEKYNSIYSLNKYRHVTKPVESRQESRSLQVPDRH